MNVLEPLGPGGNRKYRSVSFDFLADTAVSAPILQAERDAILLFEGVLLQNPNLATYWDYRVFVKTDFEVTLKRVQERDQYLFGDREQVMETYRNRYIPGQQIYLESVKPEEKADVVFINNEIGNLELILR